MGRDFRLVPRLRSTESFGFDPKTRGRRLIEIDPASPEGSSFGRAYDQAAFIQQTAFGGLPSSPPPSTGQSGPRSMSDKLARSGGLPWMSSTALGDNPENWDTTRRKASRNYSEQYGIGQKAERTGGRITKVSAFDQEVLDSHPYLQLRSRSLEQSGTVEAEGTYEGNALIKVVAGNFENGQGVQSRTFWIGGGLVASFDLQGWNNVKIKIVEILDGSFVEFAWTREGLAGENRSLYFPEVYTTAATASPVPEGAYALLIENPNPTISGTTATVEWTGQVGGSVFTFAQDVSDNSQIAFPRPYWYFGTQIPAMAPMFRIAPTAGAPASGEVFDLVWLLRPI